MTNNLIPQGYKLTDLGVIPEGWAVVRLGEVFKSYPTASYSRDQLQGGCAKCIHYGDIHTKYNTRVDVDSVEIPSISEQQAKRYTKIQDGDLILADASEDYKGVGSGVEVLNIGDKQVIAGLHTIFLKDYTNTFVDGFRGYITQNKAVKEQLERQSVGTKVYSISYNSIKECIIPVPTKPEQQKIAEVLRDIDLLIEGLKQKIAKKRAIKEGVMQQLLTGKKRLAGFSEPWVERRLGDNTNIKTGSRNGDESVEGGLYPLFVRSQIVQQINTYSYDEEAILVPGEGGIGEIFHYINGKFDCHQRVYKISNFSDAVDAKFLFYYLKRYFGEYALQQSVKATVESLRLPTFTEFTIFIPPTKTEQQAIAQILTDIDNEIAELEQKQKKYTTLKQGAMQKLLTGQIRLKI